MSAPKVKMFILSLAPKKAGNFVDGKSMWIALAQLDEH
jgi:hypothetical protein